MSDDVLAAAEKLARTLTNPGHDWAHVERVRHMALRLAKEEGADLFIVELAALMHDLWDHKFYDGDEREAVRGFLEEHKVEKETLEHVSEIITSLSFKGGDVPTPMRTVEGKCVQDADRLDALGAVGIARCFAYSGKKDHPLYNPEETAIMHQNFESYKTRRASAITHFYEKLFLLKDRMNTETAKKIAEQRDAFMHDFVDRFKKEWDGND